MPFLTQGKTNWKYILIMVVLAALVGGGILSYQWWIEKQEIETPELKIPEKAEDETATWKTYRNEEYGFEIKYPPNSGVEVHKPSHLCIEGPDYDCLASIQFSTPLPLVKTLEGIDLIIITNPNNYSAAEWTEKYTPEILSDPQTSLYKDIKIGENKWAKLVTTINTGNNRNVAFSISKNKKLYAFGIFVREGKEEIENILNQMLSTFRFLE